MAPIFGRRNWYSGSRLNRTRRQKPISQRVGSSRRGVLSELSANKK
jgi:hypothetical protein